MRNSLQELLSKFPYFLDKKEGSNFNTSEKIFNNQFIELYQNLFDTYLAGKIRKHILIWKEQTQGYEYSIHFHASLPNITEVNVLKNNEVIYTERYENTSEDSIFEHIHEDTSETLIPTDKYALNVKTVGEYEENKGFPENDTEKEDYFDHDKSLDEFGAFINLPRKEYVETTEFSNTEPPYNAQLTEDDYHYMNRLIFYLQHLHDIPLPVLEIWKLFGLSVSEINMVNREAILCKMFEESKHELNWIPSHGEHKDYMCVEGLEELFFNASVNNLTPLQMQDFSFTFSITNSLGRPTSKELFIVPFLDGERITDTILEVDRTWTVNTSILNDSEGVFEFKAYSSLDEAEADVEVNCWISNPIKITMRGCDDGDWYVNPEGDDSNDGTSAETPFQTLARAVEMVEGSKNIIVLSNDEHEISSPLFIERDTKIISCLRDDPSISCPFETFFKVGQDRELTMQNIRLKYSLREQWIDEATFTNRNTDRNHLNVVVDVIELITDTINPINLTFEDDGIDTALLDNREWDVEITDDESDATFVVDDDNENPDLIIRED